MVTISVAIRPARSRPAESWLLCTHDRRSSTSTATTCAAAAVQAPVAALVRLLAPLGIAAPAVRTAVSRMVRQGWLDAGRAAGRAAGYALTPRAARRLDEAAERIYRRGDPGWDGRWHLSWSLERIADRARRDRLRGRRWLPRLRAARTSHLGQPAAVAGARRAARGRGRAGRAVPGQLRRRRRAAWSRRAWDLDGAGARPTSAGWRRPRELIAAAGPDAADAGGVRAAQRAGPRVAQVPVHRPGAARARCCRRAGRGTRRREVFDAESARLLPAAARFVDCCLKTDDPVVQG